jgi:hypothetical protein
MDVEGLGLAEPLALGLGDADVDALAETLGVGLELLAANWWPCARPVSLACECAGGAAIK